MVICYLQLGVWVADVCLWPVDVVCLFIGCLLVWAWFRWFGVLTCWWLFFAFACLVLIVV